ncbi:hypothetical protein CKM354_000881300 [Cercospora kikuchii]|uniref:Alpha-ketoglutarate-dependent dioxygenase AlkB-like domain-containing protein n=1 Tax=Cercospora kikuchii TaxID=84275 RepID=A0A9P3CN31_9PEZI|nr:uncharacterized protein CKM354_000881300 [Cercospora kikuchii]GIZ45656.1 hypothetical protein CKM354_000881300 [Cercospora kikuchii]
MPPKELDRSRDARPTPAEGRPFIPGERSSARNANKRKNYAEPLPRSTTEPNRKDLQSMTTINPQRTARGKGSAKDGKRNGKSIRVYSLSRQPAARRPAVQFGKVVKRVATREAAQHETDEKPRLDDNESSAPASAAHKVHDEIDDSHTARLPEAHAQSLASGASHWFPNCNQRSEIEPAEQAGDSVVRSSGMANPTYETSKLSDLPQRPSTPDNAKQERDTDVSSPLSEAPSDIDLRPIPDGIFESTRVNVEGSRGDTGTQTATADNPHDLPLTDSTPGIASPPANMPRGSTESGVETLTRSTRPRRSLKPIQRFGDLVGMPREEERSDDVIIVSRSNPRTAEHKGNDLPATQDNTDAGRSTRNSVGRSRKRKRSVEDDVHRPSVPKHLRRLSSSTKSLRVSSDIVTLRVTPAKLSTAISKQPKRRSAMTAAHQEFQGVTTTGVNALPTPESTPGSKSLATPIHTLQSCGLPMADLEEPPATPELIQLSRKLTARRPIDSKEEPQGHPEVWAESRQALCETVPYFKSPQSGCYQNSGHVYAFLYDGVGNSREYMDTDVIIARAGGGMQADATGQLLQAKHHSLDDAQVQAVLNDIDHQNPIVVICGNKNAGAICKMPHRYCVLGWYKPVAVWEEKTLGKGKKAWTTVKFRLERLKDNKRAWHGPVQNNVTKVDEDLAGPLTKKTCQDCNNESPQVYFTGWMCLNSSCERFWKLSCGADAPFGDLLFNPAFLLHRTRWQNEEQPFSVRPPIPDSGKVMGDNLTNINTRGVVCPQCGRCNPRRLWRGWACDNPQCDFSNFPKHITVKPAMLHQPWDSAGEGPTLSRNRYAKHLGVKVTVEHNKLGFKIFTYTFDGINGKLVHAVSNAKINSASRGPDEMFDAMQRQDDPEMDLHLERRPFIGTGSSATLKLKTASPGKLAVTPDARKLGTDAGVVDDSIIENMLNGSQALFCEEQNKFDDSEDEDEAEESSPPKRARGRPSLSAAKTTTTTAPTEPGDLMTAFSVNYGMPYKFVAGGSSLPFSSAPWPVRACRADLNWASQNFSSASGHTDFNEQLIFAYMEGQKVEYHDDGETGLGPRIASMSLGSKAKMMLRMKAKHFVGCSKTGILTPEKPVPGSIGGREMYLKRLAAWEEAQELLASGNKRAYETRRKELPHELGIFAKRTKKAEDLVTLTLNHGDIVLMEGYEIQSYLEHKVVPEGCLRFALTCRTVLPEHLRPEERSVYGVEEDEPWMGSLGKLAAAEAERQNEMGGGDENEVV